MIDVFLMKFYPVFLSFGIQEKRVFVVQSEISCFLEFLINVIILFNFVLLATFYDNFRELSGNGKIS